MDQHKSFSDIFRGDEAQANGIGTQLLAMALTVVFLLFLIFMSFLLCRGACRCCYIVAFPLRWCFGKVQRRRRFQRVRQRIARNKPRLAEHDSPLCRCPIDASGAGVDIDGDQSDKDARYCDNERLLSAHQPYCAAHTKQRRSRQTALARRFRNGRFTFAELYYSASRRAFQRERTCEALAESIAEKLRAPDATPPTEGFVYVYMSEYDLQIQEAQTGSRAVDCDEVFFYKIGFTTRHPRKRIREHDEAVFASGKDDGVEFVDYVRVLDVRSAERIVHAMLCDDRYQRFDSIDCAFEVEWFLVSHERALEAMRRAATMVEDAILSREG